jgi:hypothetical protein
VRLPALLLALLAASCGEDRGPSVKDLEIRIETGRGEVELGKGFPLSVVRTWDRDLVPSPWSDAALAPLVARAVSTTGEERDGRVEERREFVAYAFQLDEVRVPPPRLEAAPKTGGAARSVTGRGIALRVRPALDPRNPGRPEPPGPPPRPPGSSRTWVAILGGAAVLALRRAVPRAPADIPAAERALARLRALRDDGDAGAFHDGLDLLLREFLAERFALRTRERTTEEILGSPETERALGGEGRNALAALLSRCDLARFAGERPGPAIQRSTVAAAAAFVEARP